MSKKLIYFGCGNRSKGHYLVEREDSQSLRSMDAARLLGTGRNEAIFNMIDGTFAPSNTTKQGLYQVNVIPPLMIVSWWDYTGDERGASNSNLIGTGFGTAEEMIDAAITLFPKTMARQPRPTPNPQLP